MNITNTHDESPTVKAKKSLNSKNDILELCEKQFPLPMSRKAAMYSRAMGMYKENKERDGVHARDVIKPETLAHFHIEAFGDNIECNRYEDLQRKQMLLK